MGIEITKFELVKWLSGKDDGELFREADKVRQVYCGDEVFIRGVIEFSNFCCRDCLYCGLRRSNEKIRRYRMSLQEIVTLTKRIARAGIRTIVLQSGDDFGYTREMLAVVIRKIKEENPEMAVTLCVGERPLEDYEAWREAGADRYLLKHETANPELYKRLHPRQTLETRLEILEQLKDIGYQIGAGCIVGLPGQTLEDLAEDILLIKRLDVDMAGIGPFIPQRDTPLGRHPAGSLRLTLRVLALTRIIARNVLLPATTALATLDREKGQVLGLKSGANVIMPNFTPECYRQNYRIYDNKTKVTLKEAREVIFKANRMVSESRGDSLKCLGYKKLQKASVCM